VSRNDLIANPFSYKGQIVAIQMRFIQAVAEDEAIFANYCGLARQPVVVKRTPVANLQSGEADVIVVRVLGMRKSADGTGSIPDLELVGIYRCSDKDSGCTDFAKFNRYGELMR
jgi:hypothetical protein